LYDYFQKLGNIHTWTGWLGVYAHAIHMTGKPHNGLEELMWLSRVGK
jgi:hypothetical protein